MSRENNPTSFARRGYYLHACWEFNYPFAVRNWTPQDYRGMFELLRALDMNLVMLWPTTESVPAPISDADAADLRSFRATIDNAHQSGLETWLVQSANCTSHCEIASKPFFQRHLYPFRIDVRLDDPAARDAYFKHRAQIMSILNNADGYVTIDGDPGGYPGARPEEFLRVLEADRATLDRVGTHGERQRVIPWIWCGWGSDWTKHGPWREPLEPLTTQLLETLKGRIPEPWEILPGRSATDTVSNGRTNIELTEHAGMIDRALLMLYESIEFEPSQPATVIQFDIIRQVFHREMRLTGKVRGIVGNAQQPIMSLPNLFFFARAASDLNYLDKSDAAVLADLADFLGGPRDLLATAWQSTRLGLDQLPEDLPTRLRDASLKSEVAQHIPGGPRRYLQILAQMVETRRCVLKAQAQTPRNSTEAKKILADATAVVVAWWNTTGYVFSGEAGYDFRWQFVHPAFVEPLKRFAVRHARETPAAIEDLVDAAMLPPSEASARLKELAAG